MASVSRIGHVSFTTPDLDRQLRYFEEVVGSVVVGKTGEEAFISLGLDHHNIVLRLLTFLTCNQDHHLFNLAEAPSSGLHARDGIAVKWGSSRHTAWHNYVF